MINAAPTLNTSILELTNTTCGTATGQIDSLITANADSFALRRLAPLPNIIVAQGNLMMSDTSFFNGLTVGSYEFRALNGTCVARDTFLINNVGSPATPIVQPVNSVYCEGITPDSITATGSAGGNLFWYDE